VVEPPLSLNDGVDEIQEEICSQVNKAALPPVITIRLLRINIGNKIAQSISDLRAISYSGDREM